MLRNFDWQEDIFDERYDEGSLLIHMPRRAGKSTFLMRIIDGKIQESIQEGIENRLLLIVPNLNCVGRYVDSVKDLLEESGLQVARLSRYGIDTRFFSLRFATPRTLYSTVCGMKLNLVLIDDADHMNLSRAEAESILGSCLMEMGGHMIITGTNKQGLFGSILESSSWTQTYTYIFPVEDLRKYAKQAAQYHNTHIQLEIFKKVLESTGIELEYKLEFKDDTSQALNKIFKSRLITY